MKHVFNQDEIVIMERVITDLLTARREKRCYLLLPLTRCKTGEEDLSLYEKIVDSIQGQVEATYIYSILLYVGKVKFRTNLMYDPSTLEFLL